MYCSSASFVSSTGQECGGFVGSSEGIIESCFSNSGVLNMGESRYRNVGGFAGYGWGLSNCYCKGVVSGTEEIGGFIGRGTDIYNCFSACVVQVPDNESGGFVAKIYHGIMHDDGTIENCFWDQTINNVDTSEGGTGLSTEAMQDIATYLDAGWDIVSDVNQADTSTWVLPETAGGYPRLSWEVMDE
jgi:hypothetical protein